MVEVKVCFGMAFPDKQRRHVPTPQRVWVCNFYFKEKLIHINHNEWPSPRNTAGKNRGPITMMNSMRNNEPDIVYRVGDHHCCLKLWSFRYRKLFSVEKLDTVGTGVNPMYFPSLLAEHMFTMYLRSSCFWLNSWAAYSSKGIHCKDDHITWKDHVKQYFWGNACTFW